MKGISLAFIILCLAGLMMVGSAFASGKTKQMSGSQSQATQSGEQMHEREQAREQIHKELSAEAPLLNREQVREMQRLLNQQGYAITDADGLMNQNTVRAIRRFQNNEGLAETGTPNRETLRALAPDKEQQEFFGLSPEYGENPE